MTREEFEAFRKKLGMSQAELATEFGFTPRAISMIETGHRRVQKIHELALLFLASRDLGGKP